MLVENFHREMRKGESLQEKRLGTPDLGLINQAKWRT